MPTYRILIRENGRMDENKQRLKIKSHVRIEEVKARISELFASQEETHDALVRHADDVQA